MKMIMGCLFERQPIICGAGSSGLLLLPAFDGINDCIHQFQLLLRGAVQPVDLGDNRFSMYSCDPAGKFFLARFGLGVVYDHMDRCGFSNTLSPLFKGSFLLYLYAYEVAGLFVLRNWVENIHIPPSYRAMEKSV